MRGFCKGYNNAMPPGIIAKVTISTFTRRLHRLRVESVCVAGSDADQKGSTTTEYLLGTVVLMFILLIPIPALDMSVFEFIAQAFAALQHSSTYLLSMP